MLVTKPMYAKLDCLGILKKNIKRHRKLVEQYDGMVKNINRPVKQYSNILSSQVMDSIITKTDISISRFGGQEEIMNTTLDQSMYMQFKTLSKVFNNKPDIDIVKTRAAYIADRITKVNTLENMNNLIKKIKTTSTVSKKESPNVRVLKPPKIEIKKLDLAGILNNQQNSSRSKSNKKSITNRNDPKTGSVYNVNVNLNLNLNLKMDHGGNQTDRQQKSTNRNKILKAIKDDKTKSIPLTERNSINDNTNYLMTVSSSKNNFFTKYPLAINLKKQNNERLLTDETYMKHSDKYTSRNLNLRDRISGESSIKTTRPIIDLSNPNLLKNLKGTNKVASVSPKHNNLRKEYNVYYKKYITEHKATSINSSRKASGSETDRVKKALKHIIK
jgi:hypothetical protein